LRQSHRFKRTPNEQIFEVQIVRIGTIGKGNVGTAIATGLTRAGYQVKHGHRDPNEPVADAAKWGEVVVLAVPYESTEDAAKAISRLLREKL